MTLQKDMDSKREWTPGEIDGLKQKYSRTHFTHFTMPRTLKKQRRKVVRGVVYVWKFGKWRRE